MVVLTTCFALFTLFLMQRLNAFINRFFGLILLMAAVSGLFIPSIGLDTATLIILSLAAIIFASFFKVELNRNLITDDLIPASGYFVMRFVILPVTAYFLIGLLNPFYATAFLLLLLLPAAVSSPAFTVMFNGNVSLSLKILVFSSFLSILTIPVICDLLLSKEINIDGRHLFYTMVYTIVIPFLVHLPLRRFKGLRRIITQNSPLITALGLIIVFIAATSNNRSIILESPVKVLLYTFVSVISYLVLYFIGFYLLYRQDKPSRISYSVSSGANNIGLGVTLTTLFFPGEVNVFFIVAQLSWIFMLIPMRYFYARGKK
jgi:bile acid:Na+ symporter, BASS family